jgi:2-haloacid dehalogenase
MTPPAVEALIFDVFGTVVDWREGVAAEVRRFLPDLDPHAFADAWRGEYQPAMERVRSGARGYVPLDILHRENLDRTLAAFGADLPDAERAALNHAWEKLPPWPDSAPGLARLKRRLIIAPCSNGSIALMTRLAKFGGLNWDCILGADVARAYKPDPQAYLGSAAALGLPPERVMMVAAHEDDLAAARAVGMATAFVARPLEHGTAPAGDASATECWDIIAEGIDGVADALGA